MNKQQFLVEYSNQNLFWMTLKGLFGMNKQQFLGRIF